MDISVMETNCDSLSQNSDIELFQRPRASWANEELPDERGPDSPWLGEARPGSRLLLRHGKCSPRTCDTGSSSAGGPERGR